MLIVTQIERAHKRKSKMNSEVFMDTMATESRKKYYAEWRAKNKDKVREYNARYWAKRAEREAKATGQEQKEGDASNG